MHGGKEPGSRFPHSAVCGATGSTFPRQRGVTEKAPASLKPLPGVSAGRQIAVLISHCCMADRALQRGSGGNLPRTTPAWQPGKRQCPAG